MADPEKEPRRESRQQIEGNRGDRSEQRQPQVEIGEDDAERQHRSKIGDKAGGKNDLAQFGLVEAGLDHHRIDDGNRCRRQ